MDIKYLITGTGRCGTVYLAKLFNLAGIACSHENMFSPKGFTEPSHNSVPAQRENVPEQKIIYAESSMYAAPFVNAHKWKVIHVTRHPLKVIRSFVFDLGYFSDDLESKEEWIRNVHSYFSKQLPNMMKKDGPIYRASYFYIHWNSIIENTNNEYLHYRIEDKPDSVLKFVDAPKVYLEDVLCNSFSKRHIISEDLQWSDIPKPIRNELMSVSNKYGYEC
jgi:hypothetical protein